jgi:hypothetical protein
MIDQSLLSKVCEGSREMNNEHQVKVIGLDSRNRNRNWDIGFRETLPNRDEGVR